MENFSGYLKKEIPITDYASRLGYQLSRIGRYYTLREHDSVRIDPEKNAYWRNSTGRSGSIIDFCVEFGGAKTPREAIKMLANLYNIHGDGERAQNVKRPEPQSARRLERKPGSGVDKPEADSRVDRVIRYLDQERKIQSSVIQYFLERNMLYQDKRGNAVFSTDKFACLRSTGGTRFVADCTGNDYNECFYFRGSNEAKELVVCESVIDVMSVMSYFTLRGIKPTDYCYLALAGTGKYESVFYHVEKEGAGLSAVYLALDNDDKGREAGQKIKEGLQQYPGVTCRNAYPPKGKDWNDYIKSITLPAAERSKKKMAIPNVYSKASDPRLDDISGTVDDLYRECFYLTGEDTEKFYAIWEIIGNESRIAGEAGDVQEQERLAKMAEEVRLLAGRERMDSDPSIDTSVYNLAAIQYDFYAYVNSPATAGMGGFGYDDLQLDDTRTLSVKLETAGVERPTVLISVTDENPEQGRGTGAHSMPLSEFINLSITDFNTLVGQIYGQSMEYEKPQQEQGRSQEQIDREGNPEYYKRFYAPDQQKQMEAYRGDHPDYKTIFASEQEGENGDTWIVYRDVSDLPKYLQNYASQQEANRQREADRIAQEQAEKARAEQDAASRPHGEDAKMEQPQPPPPSTPAVQVERGLNMQERKDQLKSILEAGVKSVMTDGDKFKNWLDTSGHFFTNGYSVRNAILIFMQKPDATYCMGYEAWKDYGRTVQQGAKSAMIYVPVIAYEKGEGQFFNTMVKKPLQEQLRNDPTLNPASVRIGTSKIEITLTQNGIYGLKIGGRERQQFANENNVKQFITNAVLGKVPMYFTTGNVFDKKDVAIPEYLWVKKGFKKEEMVRDGDGKPVKNKRGEYKIINTPERQARFVETIAGKVPDKDPAKMAILLESLKAVAERNNVPVNEATKQQDETLRGGANGYFNRQNKTITIDADLSPTEKCTVLLHEMAHSDLHGDLEKLAAQMGENVPRGMREVQAEAVAYTVAKQFGIETDTSSFTYLAAWSNGVELQDLSRSIGVIYEEARKMTNEIKAELDKRGLDLSLEQLPKDKLEPMKPESVRAVIAEYMNRALAEDDSNKSAMTELLQTATRYHAVQAPDIMENLEAQRQTLNSKAQTITDIKDLCARLEKSTSREEQERIIAKLDAGMERIQAANTKQGELTGNFVNLAAELAPGRYEEFARNPEQVIAEMRNNGLLPQINDVQAQYLAKSDYVRSNLAPMLREPGGDEMFAEAAAERAAAISKVAAKNSMFVEISFCEQWTDTPFFKKGALLHPNVANSLSKDAEAIALKMSREYEAKGEYFPYTKCSINVFYMNPTNGTLDCKKDRIDIGDGYQKSFYDFYKQTQKPESDFFKAFNSAVHERGAKDKMMFNEYPKTPDYSLSAEVQQERIEGEAQAAQDLTMTLQEASEQAEQAVKDHTPPEPQTPDKNHSNDSQEHKH